MGGLLLFALLLALGQQSGTTTDLGELPEADETPDAPAGSTAIVAPISNAAKTELAKQACAMLSTGASISGGDLYIALGKAAYPSISWPPPANASESHLNVWRELADWVNALAGEAAAANRSLCDFLTKGPATAVPKGPAQINPGAVPTLTPTPGRLYRIRTGDNLLKVTGQAYGLQPGGARLAKSKTLNGHPANAKLRFRAPANSFEQTAYAGGVLSFGAPFQTIFVPAV